MSCRCLTASLEQTCLYESYHKSDILSRKAQAPSSRPLQHLNTTKEPDPAITDPALGKIPPSDRTSRWAPAGAFGISLWRLQYLFHEFFEPGCYLGNGLRLHRFPVCLAHGFFGHLHAKAALLHHRRMTLSFGNGHRTE
jgi:hypothetical protein